MKKIVLSVLISFLFFTIILEAKNENVTLIMGDHRTVVDVNSVEELQSYVKNNYPDFSIKLSQDVKELQSEYKLEKLNEYKINYYGKEGVYYAPQGTVADVLSYSGLKYDNDDIVIPDLSTSVQNDKITVLAVEEKIATRDVTFAFKTLKRESTNPELLEELVVQQGVNGVKRVTQKERYVNGVLQSALVIKQETIVPATSKIVETPMNTVETLTRSAVRSYVMQATAYEAGPLSTGKRPGDRGYGITATGTRARRGSVAVDPRVIPLGTKLYIQSMTPGIPDYGYAIAEDTGGAIKGMKIDLFMNTVAECFQFGRRSVRVFILPADTPIELFR